MSTLSRKVLSGTGRAGGSFIAAAGGSGLYVYDHRNPGNISVADSNTANAYQTAAFRPDGKYIAAGTNIAGSPNLYIFDFTSFTSLSVADTFDLNGPSNRPKRKVERVRWSPDGKYLAVAMDWEPDSGFDELYLMDCTDPTNISISDSVDRIGAVFDLAFTPNGDYLAASTSQGLALYDTTTAGTLTLSDSYEGLGTFNYAVAVNFDGTRIALGRIQGSSADRVYLFDHSTPGTLSLLSSFNNFGTFDAVRGLAFTADGSQLMCAVETSPTTANVLRLLNVASDGTLSLERTYSVAGLSAGIGVNFSPDGLQMVLGGFNSVRLFDFSPPNSLTQTDSSNAPGQTFDVSFSLV
jgi:hypothetical protein